MRQYQLFFLICFNLFLFYASSVDFGATVVVAVATSLYKLIYRSVFNWTSSDDEDCSNQFTHEASVFQLSKRISTRLHGQHLVKDAVVPALRKHLANKSPKKALVMSFHGGTGTGKTYLAKMVAESLFQEGTKSRRVHQFVTSVHFPKAKEATIYKRQIRDWIRGNATSCGFSLFIFDEVERLPQEVLDSIKPYFDYREKVFGMDFRRSIFLLLSSTGSGDIYQAMTTEGRSREGIFPFEAYELIDAGVFEEVGGLHHSDVIDHSLVDVYVPLLPLEKSHVVLCIRDEFIRRKLAFNRKAMETVLGSITFNSHGANFFSSTGCKKVASTLEIILN